MPTPTIDERIATLRNQTTEYGNTKGAVADLFQAVLDSIPDIPISSWLPPVAAIVDSGDFDPGTPTEGDRYIIRTESLPSAFDPFDDGVAFAQHGIVAWDGATWAMVETPATLAVGATAYIIADFMDYCWSGTIWQQKEGGGTSGTGGATDAADLTYTPATLSDWTGSSDPGNADAALDQLAARTADLEGASSGGLTNITETLHTSSPNDTVNAEQLEVTGGTTNVDLVQTPKGTGAFILGPKPDGTATGGNKRGAYAVDFQTRRAYANQGASGDYSFVAPGGDYANTASGPCSATFGSGNTASSIAAFAIGESSVASTRCGFASGRLGAANRANMRAHGGDLYNSQYIRLIPVGKTTDGTTPVSLKLSNYYDIAIPSGIVAHLTITILGVESNGTTVARYLRQVTIKNVSGTTELVGSVIVLGTDVNAGTSIALTADDTNDALKIEVTGITAETWRWVAVVEGAELAYGA